MANVWPWGWEKNQYINAPQNYNIAPQTKSSIVPQRENKKRISSLAHTCPFCPPAYVGLCPVFKHCLKCSKPLGCILLDKTIQRKHSPRRENVKWDFLRSFYTDANLLIWIRLGWKALIKLSFNWIVERYTQRFRSLAANSGQSR